MILDTSAILAVLFDEDDAKTYAAAITKAESCSVSAATFLETSIVVEAQAGSVGGRQLDAFFRRAGIAIQPFTEDQTHIARQAFIDFGKGRHSARLNYGDCFSYALAKATGEPLLFKGNDFSRTDVTAAI